MSDPSFDIPLGDSTMVEGVAADQWTGAAPAYGRIVADAAHSSTFLREQGLKPEMARLVGDCSDKSLLDVGTGGGWLFERVFPRDAHACDLVVPSGLAPNVAFRVQDATRLDAYADASFDVVTSSLVLCYCEDLAAALREMARVSKPGGRLVVALVHPYFYRTGAVVDDGFEVRDRLAEERSFPIAIGEAVGPFRYFFRPFPTYVNALLDAGWTLEYAKDWFFDRAAYAASGVASDGVLRTHKVPVFCFLRCVRAAK